LYCIYMVFPPYLTSAPVHIHTSLQYTALELLIALHFTSIFRANYAHIPTPRAENNATDVARTVKYRDTFPVNYDFFTFS